MGSCSYFMPHLTFHTGNSQGVLLLHGQWRETGKVQQQSYNGKINTNVDMQDTCTAATIRQHCMHDIMLCTHVHIQERTKWMVKFQAWYIYEESEADKIWLQHRKTEFKFE